MTDSTHASIQSDLESVIPFTRSITLDGDVAFQIEPIRIGRLPQIIEALQPFMHLFELRQVPNLFVLLTVQTEEVLWAMAVLLNVPRATVDKLQVDEAIKLLTAWLEVNIDFLLQRVLPQLPQIIAAMKKIQEQVVTAQGAIGGPTKSNP